jgi:hypothetical protein
VAFLGFSAPFQSAKLAFSLPGMNPLNGKKKLDRLGLVFYDTGAQALQVGQRPDALDSLPLVEADGVTPTSTVWPEYEEPAFTLPGEWVSDSRLFLLARAPNPCTVGAAMVDASAN